MKRNGRLVRALLCAALIMLALAVGAVAADTATETWLAASGNQLWVGGEQVTAANADNITGSGIEGAVSFAVKDGVPTLTLNGATITGGKKVNRSGVYVQPVYCPGADLTVVLSGNNRIIPAAQENAATVGFFAPGEDEGKLTITGDENATLEVRTECAALYIYEGLTLRGGKGYTFHSGGYYGSAEYGKAFYSEGPIVIENATVTAESENGAGIYSDCSDSYGDFDDYTVNAILVRNSTVTATGSAGYDGIYATGRLNVQNSSLTTTGGSSGINVYSPCGVQFSGERTVINAKSTGNGPSIVSSCGYNYSAYSYGYIFLEDELEIAVPADGIILYQYDLNTNPKCDGNTITDGDWNVASAVTIHKHSFTREAVEDGYKKSVATCTSPAKYYYSCSIEQDGSACGAAGTTTFAYGEKAPANHTGEPGDWLSDADGHWKEYACCGVRTAQAGHTEELPVKENDVAAACETDGGYDDVVYCEVCSKELSRTSHTIPATGHVWGDWIVTTPATVNAAGVETKTCQNDPSHTMTRAIKKLTPTTGTVGVPSVRDVPAAGAEAAKTAFSACAGSRACPIHPFEDASSAAWYHDGVHYCLDEGLMTGVGGGRFAPDGGMTRAMLVAVLYRLEGEPDADGGAAFTDVAADAWYAGAVGWASSEGIVDGYGDGRFGPDDALTREQLAAILYRYARYRGLAAAADEALTRYADAAQIAGYAVSALRWACGSGLVDGMVQNGRAVLLPASAVTRAQTAAILQRLCTKLL